MQGKNIGDGAIQRRRHADLFSELHNAAGQPAHLKPISTLEIVMHGRGHVVSHVVCEGEALLRIIPRQIDSMRAPYGGNFPHDVQ